MASLGQRKQKRFIVKLAETGNVSRACAVIGIDRSAAYLARAESEEFAKAWDEALEKATDALEEEAWRRAVTGTDKPVFQQGQLVGHIREYSDSLLTVLLKANRPAKYRDNVRMEHTGAGGGPIEIREVEVRLSDDGGSPPVGDAPVLPDSE